MLEINAIAPDFTLPDQDHKLHSLSDYFGRYILMYFYPADDTPGCTKEACVIRDMYIEFESNNVKVLGINSNGVESHKKFAAKYNLPFTLLSDTERKVIKAYDADKLLGTKRMSYLISPQGTIAKVYKKVDPTTHGMEILKDIYALKENKVPTPPKN